MSLQITKMTPKGVNANFWRINEVHYSLNTLIVRLYGYPDESSFNSGNEPLDIKHFDFSFDEDRLSSLVYSSELASLLLGDNPKVGWFAVGSILEDMIKSREGWESAIKQ